MAFLQKELKLVAAGGVVATIGLAVGEAKKEEFPSAVNVSCTTSPRHKARPSMAVGDNVTPAATPLIAIDTASKATTDDNAMNVKQGMCSVRRRTRKKTLHKQQWH